ncbi:MAG TPA: hypothetical protein VER98_18615 [Terriglobia bacterium]|nr:hypothetical protein [Terriglobia bacterium]
MWTIEEVPKVYLMALVAWQAARGCSVEGIRGVLHAIDNRARSGPGHVEIALGLLTEDTFPRAQDRVFFQILGLTEQVLMGQDQDLTGGATRYYESGTVPEWAEAMRETAHIGTFRFLK